MNYLPQSVFCKNELLSGHLPLWNAYQFCGQTLLNNGNINFINPGSLFYIFLEPAWAYTLEIFLYSTVLVFGSWVYFRKKNYGAIPALIGAIIYLYSGQTFFWAIYHGQNLPISVLPVTLVFFIKYEETHSWKWKLLAFSMVFLMCCGGFFHLTLFALLTILAEGMEKLNIQSLLGVLRRRGKIVLLALAASSFTLLPALETVLFSHRNLVPYRETFNPDPVSLVLMSFLGVHVGWNKYPQYFFFLGMSAVGLAFYTLRNLWRTIIIKPIFIFSFLLFFFAIFTSCNIIPRKLLFGISTDPWRSMFVVNFCLALLAAQGMQHIVKQIEQGRRVLYPPIEIAVIWSITLILELFAVTFLLKNKFMNYIATDYTIIFFCGTILALGLLLYGSIRADKISKKKYIYSLLMLAFLLANVLLPSALYLRSNVFSFVSGNEPWKILYLPVSKLSGEGRFIELGLEGYQLENWGIYNRIRALGGYNSFFPRSIFKRMLKDGMLPDTFNALTRFKVNRVLQADKLSYYGVEYLILHSNKKTLDFLKEDWQLYQELNNGIRIFRNRKFVGRSYVTDAKYNMLHGAEIIRDTSNEIIIRTKANKGEVVILADSWFPGWKCYYNGKSVLGYDADGFRAYRVKGNGEHQVKWVYEPFSMKIGIYVSIAAVILFFVLKDKEKEKLLT